MQITPEQGAFMAILAELIGAKRYLEIGVFTGYSSLSVALAMGADGRITALDTNATYTETAKRYWKEAGLEENIELRLGDARTSLAELAAEGQAGSYDFAFIDADKSGYDDYYEACLNLLRRHLTACPECRRTPWRSGRELLGAACRTRAVSVHRSARRQT